MKKVIFALFLLVVTVLPTAKTWSQTDTTDKFICVYRSDMEHYCPGLLSDLERRYGPTLGVNPKKSSATRIAGMSREIGSAVNEALGSITNRSEQIAKTNVGRFTLAMIAYKVMGKSIVRLAIGIPILILIIFLFIKWWARIGVPRLKYTKKDESPNKYECQIEYPGIGEQLLWGIAFLVIIWIALAVIV